MNSIAVRASTLDLRNSIVVGATLTVAVIAGWWLAPQHGINALFVVLAGVAGLVVFAWPIVGVYLLVATIPIQDVFVLGGEVTWVRLIGISVLGAWVLRKLIRREPWAPVLAANVLIPALLFGLLAFASLLWAINFDLGVKGVLKIPQLLVLSLLIVGVVNSKQQLEWLVRLLVVGALIAAALTLFQSFVQGAVKAGDSVTGRSSETAITLVVLLPLGFYLLRGSGSQLWRLVGLVFAAVGPLAVALTLSRTSFVLLPVILGFSVWAMFKDSNSVKGRLLVALMVLVLGIVLAATVPWERVLTRGNTIVPAVQGEAHFSRIQQWLAGIAMFNDYPLLGVGYGNYRHHFLTRYQFTVPTQYIARVFTTLRGPHSTVVAIMSELGVVGMALWVWLMSVAFLNIRQSWVRSAQSHNRDHEIIVRTIFYCLVAYAVYSFFAITHTHKLLWVLLSLTVVLRGLVSRDEEYSS